MRRVLLVAPLAFALSSCQFQLTTAGSWTAQTPPPVSIVETHITATADGRVVVLGGFMPQTGQPLAQALIFDPATGRWTNAAPIPELRTSEAVVALADGTVLIVGGQGAGAQFPPQGGPLLASTWLFDPAGDRWTRVGHLHTARMNPSAVRLTDGRVLVVGGSIPRAQPLQLANGGTELYQDIASAEIFDPAPKTWSPAGELSTVRNSISLVALPGGMALAAGGCASDQLSSALRSADLFNPATAGWVTTTPLPEGRCGPDGVALRDGRVLLIGGLVGGPAGFQPAPSAVLYDPRAQSWAPAGSSIVQGAFSRQGSDAVLLRDGTVFLPADASGPPRGTVATTVVGGQLYRPATGDWAFVTSTSTLESSSFGEPAPPVAVALPSGKAVVLLESDALIFDPHGHPPPGQALDNIALTWILLSLDGLLILLLAAGLVRGRRSWKRRLRAGQPAA